MFTLFGIDPPAEHFRDYLERICKVMNELWTQVLRLGVDVSPDFAF